MVVEFFRNIKNAFYDITLIFSGNRVENKNPEIREMISEIYDIEIPHTSTDRANLKKDSDAIIEDYKKAYGEKMAEGQD
jgi:hypothetical protein